MKYLNSILVCVLTVIIIVGTIKAADPNTTPNVSDPNSTVRKIVMPRNAKLPEKYKCPVHGNVGESILTIEIEGKRHIYCKKCAMKFLVDVLDLNLPKLEKVK